VNCTSGPARPYWVIFSQLRPALFDQLRGPRLIGQTALEPRAEVHKFRGGRIVAATFGRAWRLQMPDSGEVGLAVSGTGNRRGEVGIPVAKPWHSSGWIVDPLGGGWYG
jgi:hypothetical protein